MGDRVRVIILSNQGGTQKREFQNVSEVYFLDKDLILKFPEGHDEIRIPRAKVFSIDIAKASHELTSGARIHD
jgi:hypothetical protein